MWITYHSGNHENHGGSLVYEKEIIFVSDDRVLVMGGMATDTNPRDFFRSIDLEENKWKALPPIPTPRYATFSFLINEKLYVIGTVYMGLVERKPASVLRVSY